MAAGGRIQGITIQLGADTTTLVAALRDSQKAISNTHKELKMVERALKLDPGNTELLRQQQELLQQAVSETTTKLDALRQAQAEVQRKFEAGEISAVEYRSFQRELITTEQSLNRFQQELDELGQTANEAERDVGQMAQGVRDAGNNIKTAGQNMMGVTAGLGAVAGAAGFVAIEFDNMSAKIRNSVNGTEQELSGLEDAAKSVWREGFGESMEDVTNSIIQVKNNMHGLTGEEIEQATKSAMVLGQTFDADVNEVTRAGSNLMTNFGATSDEVWNTMAAGAKAGMNFSNEMFDNLSEYSADFARAGFSMEDMFNALIKGAQSGTYNLDGLNDVVREFGIQGSENVEGFAEGIGRLSPETQKIYDAFTKGKATMKDVMNASIADLQKMDDQVAVNQIGTSLFGAKWGDLGSEAILSMGGITDQLGNVDGKMNEMIETQEQTFGQRFQGMLRTAQEALLPLGNILLDMASEYLPPLIEKVTAVADWFSNLSSGTQNLIVGIGLFVAALAPLLTVIGMVVGALANLVAPVMTVFSWFKKLQGLWMVVQTTVLALGSSLAIPIAIIAALVAAGILLWKNWDTVKEKAGQLKDWTVNKFNELKTGTSNAIESAKKAVSDKFNQLKTNASNAVESARKTVTDKFNQIKTGATNAVESARSAVTNKFNQIKTGATNAVENARSAVVNKFNAIKTGASNAVENARSAVVNKFNQIKSGVESAVNLVETIVKRVFNNAKNLMTNPVESAKNLIKTSIDKIAGFFSGLKLKLPEIKLPKMPKFKLTGEFSLNPPRVPKLSVQWNAKGGIFNKPTIFNTPEGLQGVGEAGKEAILPLTDQVLGGIGKGIAATMKGGAQQIIVNPQPIYLDGELIGNVTFDTINQRQFTAAQLAAIGRGVQM